MGKIFAIVAIMTVSLSAQAKWSERAGTSSFRATSHELVNALNTLYPELELEVDQRAHETVLVDELQALKGVLSGQDLPDGSLIHLACCKPSCGGDKGCR